MNVTKAIIPAAGLGTRFLPLTKSIPKEMLPLVNKPAIQYTIEEGVSAGINHFSIVTSRAKSAIADHFDLSAECESRLEQNYGKELLSDINNIIRNASFNYVRQSEPLGLGHAIWQARHFIGKEYFAVFLPDDIIVSKQPAIEQMIRVARQEKGSVIAVQEVPPECVSSYGIIDIKKNITPNLFQVSNLVEKPSPKDAPSNLAIVGRYVLSHKIFPSLEEISTYDINGEIQLTDAISHMLRHNEKVFAYKIRGTRYDIGTPLGWMKAVIGCALQHQHYGPHIRKFLSELETSDSFLFDVSKTIEHQR